MPDLPPQESIILPELYRSCRTVQIQCCLATSTNHVNMGRSMIVRINHNPQSIKPENRRHYTDSSKVPKRLGLMLPSTAICLQRSIVSLPLAVFFCDVRPLRAFGAENIARHLVLPYGKSCSSNRSLLVSGNGPRKWTTVD